MSCCSGPKWKREVVPDHKFDFIDTREFTDNGFFMRLKYLWLYIIVLKSFLVYVSDIFSAITMLTTFNWSNELFWKCKEIEGCVFVSFNVGKWLFVGCIIFSFLLLAYESRKAKKIIASRDISYAFTNVLANNYYSLRSYDHFCFFDHISNSTKLSDDFAFFVFFVFKSWKRLLLADGPRQSINALVLYAVYLVKKDLPGPWYDVSKYFYGNRLSTSALTVTSLFTVLVFAGSLLLLIVAAICYVPLLCHIRGNLKEYCCHKVDKRIGDVIKRRRGQRLADAARQAEREAKGDFSHLKNKKGELIGQPLPQPTLPNLSPDDGDVDSTQTKAPSTYNTDPYKYSCTDLVGPPDDHYPVFPPRGHYHPNASAASFHSGFEDQSNPHLQYFDDKTSLTASAAPMASDPSPIERQGLPPFHDPRDIYLGYGQAVSSSTLVNPSPPSHPHLAAAPLTHRFGNPITASSSSVARLAYDSDGDDNNDLPISSGGAQTHVAHGNGHPEQPANAQRGHWYYEEYGQRGNWQDPSRAV